MNTLFEPTFRHHLFEHQMEALAGTLAELAVSDRCQVLTGKTCVGLGIAMARARLSSILSKKSLRAWQMLLH